MTSAGPTHYRIHDVLYEEGLHLRAQAFDVRKETPEGYWVVSHSYVPSWMDFAALRKHGYLRWVSKTSERRYCYPTLEEALHSFKRRKERQVIHARASLEKAEKALAGLEQCQGVPANELVIGINVGKLPNQELNWIFD